VEDKLRKNVERCIENFDFDSNSITKLQNLANVSDEYSRGALFGMLMQKCLDVMHLYYTPNEIPEADMDSLVEIMYKYKSKLSDFCSKTS